jgi:hypothetical protein
MLEQEFKYYVANQNELVKKYKGKYLIIKGEKVIGAYDDEITAYTEAVKNNEVGTFLLHECQPGEANYTQTFRNRVVFR